MTSADEIGSLKVAAAKGTTQELALSAMAPKATIMRTEDDATAAAAYVSGQAELFATNSLIIPDLQKRNPSKEFELKFTIRRSPAHMGVRMGEHNLVRWLDSFIFFNMMNGEIDRLHQKWLGMTLRRCRRCSAFTAPGGRQRPLRRESRRCLGETSLDTGVARSAAEGSSMTEIDWSRLKASEIKALAQRNAIVIVPIGATEQHGPHLPSMVDWRCVHEVSHRAARIMEKTRAGGGGADHPLRHVRASHVAQRHHHARLRDDVCGDPLRRAPRRSATASSASSC